jgi:hypothetical protein
MTSSQKDDETEPVCCKEFSNADEIKPVYGRRMRG